MKLSILIPMYNVEDYVGNCLKSIVNQDIPFSEYEVIIIDDGSTDSSKSIAEDYAAKYNNITLHSQYNIGLYATRNKLLRLAKGDYIYNLDSDDYIVYNSLGTILNAAIENDLDFLGFDYISTPKMNIYSSTKEKPIASAFVQSGNDFMTSNLNYANTVWWYIVKRDFLNSNNLKFEVNNPLGDGPFTLRLLHMVNRMMYLPLDVHRYVVVPSSIMNSNERKHLGKMIDNYIEIFDSYNLLVSDISEKKDSDLNDVVLEVKHWRDVNVYVMFYTLIKSGISINEINKILSHLDKIGAYPIKYFIGKRYNSFKHRILIYFFNRKLIFYAILFPCRLLYKFKILNF